MTEIGQSFIEEARRLLREDYLPKIERCLEQLDHAQLWWRPNDESNSVGNLLLHLAGNARQWIVCGVGGARDGRERDAEFGAGRQPGGGLPGGAELLDGLRATLREADEVLAHLDPASLLETRDIQGLAGVQVLRAVFHAVEHFATHTGQIVLLTKQLAARDLAFYDFSGGAPRADWLKKRP